MINVLASSVTDRGLEPRSDQTKVYEIGICCFSAKHAALRRKNKEWLSRNQDNVSEWSDMSSTKQISSSSHGKLTCSPHDMAERLQSWR